MTATKLETFLDGVRAIRAAYYAKNFPTNKVEPISTTEGPKYFRVVIGEEGNDQRSVYAFVDKTTGAIYKAAGWKAPAKHARGNINDEFNGLKAMGPYGPAYLR